MIVSHSKNLIYCRLPKSASTSVSAALEPFSSRLPRTLPARVLRKTGLGAGHHRLFDFRHHSHMSLKGVQNILPAKGFNRALKLTVVRHPVTWVFSYYNHLLRGQFQPQYAQVFQEVRTAQSFDYFLDWLGDKPKRPISTQLIDENGEYLVDAVVRCEALMAEASVHFAPRGIEISVSKLNTGNYSTPEFSTDQKDKIFELYQDDMTAFGYGPDSALQAPVLKATPATRQVAKELGAEGLARYDCWSPF